MANCDIDDLEVVPSDQQETEEDVKPNAETIADAVLFNTDWTVETIYNQIRKGNINLDPEFQRREAWDDNRKSRLIESIICGFPVPNIVLAEDKPKKGQYIVIDGKQRLFSIVSFMNNELKLTGMKVRQDLNGATCDDIRTKHEDIANGIDNQPIRTTIIRSWPDEDYLYTVFYRLNSGSLPLSPQELRKALHGGKLLNKIDDYIRKSATFREIFGEKLDPRMRDVEIVLRYLAFERDYKSYDGNLKKFLDNEVVFYNENWDQKQQDLLGYFEKLEVALKTSIQVFGKDSFKKWNGDTYEKRINRAVFDVITRYFTDASLSHIYVGAKNEIVDAFKGISSVAEFRDAVEKTTKTPRAVRNRHTIWGWALAKVIGRNLDETEMRLV